MDAPHHVILNSNSQWGGGGVLKQNSQEKSRITTSKRYQNSTKHSIKTLNTEKQNSIKTSLKQWKQNSIRSNY